MSNVSTTWRDVLRDHEDDSEFDWTVEDFDAFVDIMKIIHFSNSSYSPLSSRRIYNMSVTAKQHDFVRGLLYAHEALFSSYFRDYTALVKTQRHSHVNLKWALLAAIELKCARWFFRFSTLAVRCENIDVLRLNPTEGSMHSLTESQVFGTKTRDRSRAGQQAGSWI